MNVPLNQMPNPTKEQRHEMLRDALEREGRPEDYEYITQFLSPPNEITTIVAPGALQGAKIGILGGGVAGMAAAFELRKLGADITILEASEDRIGGRIYTYYYEPSRTYFGEFGAMRIPISHETTWYYIDQLGLDTVSMTSPRRNNFIYVHNTRIRTTQSIEEYLYPFFDLTPQERNTPWSELSEYAFQYAFRILPADIRAELIQVLPEYSPQILALMNISLRQNFEELGLSQGAIQLLSGVDSAAGALLHNSYTEYAHEEYSLDFLNTYHIKGGNVNLPLAFYESFLSENPSVYSDIDSSSLGKVIYKSGHRVTGIYQSNYRNKIIIRYTNTFDMTESADIFDYVICSLPFSALRTVEIKPYLSNIKMQAITEVYYANAQKTQFFCNRRFWERNTDYGNIIGGISFTDLPIQSIIYPSDHNQCLINQMCSSEEPGVLLASYGLEQNATRIAGLEPMERYETIRQNIEEVHGLPKGFLNSFIISNKTVNWFTEPNFRGAFAYYLPGQKELFGYEIQRPEYQNRLFFAGEHTSAKHGWIQGALFSGKMAANQLAYTLNTL